jgi:hypothetical protein
MRSSVRLIDQNGKRAQRIETAQYYHPENWRAATQSEQLQMMNRLAELAPWYPCDDPGVTDIFEYVNTGDGATNNGQEWSGIDDSLVDRWEVERERRRRFEREERERLKEEQQRRWAEWGEK